ncbi:MAG: CBS domain-containing protein [Hyphomonadaceae bacterium]
MLIAQVIRDKGAAVYTLASEATLEEAAREMNEKRVGALIVIDAEGELVGVLSERDIIREIARRGPAALDDRVAIAMTREVIVASLDESVDEGLGRMTDRRVRHLPVLAEGRLVGIISIGDLVKHRIAVAEAEAAAMQAYISAQ